MKTEAEYRAILLGMLKEADLGLSQEVVDHMLNAPDLSGRVDGALEYGRKMEEHQRKLDSGEIKPPDLTTHYQRRQGPQLRTPEQPRKLEEGLGKNLLPGDEPEGDGGPTYSLSSPRTAGCSAYGALTQLTISSRQRSIRPARTDRPATLDSGIEWSKLCFST